MESVYHVVMVMRVVSSDDVAELKVKVKKVS